MIQNYAFDVLQRATYAPDSVALQASDQAMTYAGLRDRIVFYALHMRRHGIKRGTCIGLDANRMPEGPALALAAALLGARWVEAKATVDPVLLGVTHILSINPAAQGAGVYVVDADWTAAPEGLDANEPISFEGFGSNTDIAFYVESSGTTGRPKLIARPYRNAWPAIDKMRPVGLRKVFTMFPPLSSAGFAFRVAAFLEGATVVVRAPTYGDLWADGVELVQASPAQAQALCAGAVPADRRLPRLIAWGAQMPPRLVRHWLDYFDEVELGYGSREASGVGRVVVRDKAATEEILYRIVGDADVQIVDDADQPVPPETSGTIRIRTGILADGYVGAPDASDTAFRRGWFYPGDLGMLTSDGRLRVLGRVGDRFNLGGVKANATDIDDTASTVAGVGRAVSFSRSTHQGIDEVCVAVVIAGTTRPEQVAANLRATFRAEFGSNLVVSAVFVFAELPLNEAGKDVRSAVRQLCEALPSY